MTSKKVVSILNKITKFMFDLNTYHETIFKLTLKHQPQRLDKVLRKHSKRKRADEEIEDQYNQLSKYLKSQQEKTVAERVKLMPQKRKKEELGSKS